MSRPRRTGRVGQDAVGQESRPNSQRGVGPKKTKSEAPYFSRKWQSPTSPGRAGGAGLKTARERGRHPARPGEARKFSKSKWLAPYFSEKWQSPTSPAQDRALVPLKTGRAGATDPARGRSEVENFQSPKPPIFWKNDKVQTTAPYFPQIFKVPPAAAPGPLRAWPTLALSKPSQPPGCAGRPARPPGLS